LPLQPMQNQLFGHRKMQVLQLQRTTETHGKILVWAFYNGKFYISTDGGLTFTDTKAPQLPKSVNKIKAVPGKEGHVWLAAREGGLWRSTDGGYTFEKLSNVDTAHVVGFGKAAPGQDYMAIYITGKIDNVLGFFRSDDAGKTWVRINDDEHGYGAVDTAITGDPRVYGRVYIATNGRGIVYQVDKGLVGDLNGDNRINSTDLTLMKRYILKSIEDLPVEDDLWAAERSIGFFVIIVIVKCSQCCIRFGTCYIGFQLFKAFKSNAKIALYQ